MISGRNSAINMAMVWQRWNTCMVTGTSHAWVSNMFRLASGLLPSVLSFMTLALVSKSAGVAADCQAAPVHDTP